MGSFKSNLFDFSPTASQLGLLKKLGIEKIPASKGEASELIKKRMAYLDLKKKGMIINEEAGKK